MMIFPALDDRPEAVPPPAGSAIRHRAAPLAPPGFGVAARRSPGMGARVFAGCACVVAGALALACARSGEPARCLEDRQAARNLALQGQLEEASQRLDRVKAHCGPNSASDIHHIGKLIEEKRAARQARELRQARERELRERLPSKDFIAWATHKDGDVAEKASAAVCAPRGAPDFGFCEARRPEAPNMSVRYATADRKAYRYALATNVPPSCGDLGEYRQVRAWTRQGVTYELCELTHRRLRHLTALLVHQATEHQMYIFSQEYATADADFERLLRVIPAVN